MNLCLNYDRKWAKNSQILPFLSHFRSVESINAAKMSSKLITLFLFITCKKISQISIKESLKLQFYKISQKFGNLRVRGYWPFTRKISIFRGVKGSFFLPQLVPRVPTVTKIYGLGWVGLFFPKNSQFRKIVMCIQTFQGNKFSISPTMVDGGVN